MLYHVRTMDEYPIVNCRESVIRGGRPSGVVNDPDAAPTLSHLSFATTEK